MFQYRLLFFNGSGAVHAGQEFRADEDDEAIVLASIFAEALADGQASYELWTEARCVVSTRHRLGLGHRPISIDEIGAERQRHILDVEETFQRSHWRLAQSGKLIEVMNDLRRRVRACPP